MRRPLVIIVGPTAVGKTETSINIAQQLNGEIISADSMQVYKYMDIGSAKPSLKERAGVPHYLMDEIDPRHDFSVMEFQQKAREYIEMISLKGKLPIIVGGTGLYVNSIIYNLDFTNTSSDWELRKRLEAEAKEFGNQFLHDKLKKIDVHLANRIHPNNVKKVIRALEVYEESGDTIKEFRESFVENPLYNYLLIGLTRNRAELYDRINKRVDLLIEKGLIEEVKRLTSMGLDDKAISMKGLGYKEIIKYLKGEYELREAIDIIKRDTRRYAKRQLTWFNRYEKIKWFDFNNYRSNSSLEKDLINYIEGYFHFV